jgi:quinol monooxygenase YgiN
MLCTRYKKREMDKRGNGKKGENTSAHFLSHLSISPSYKEENMHTRLFYGTIQTGKEQEALTVLNEFVDRVKQFRGCLLGQLLQTGNEIVGISTWETKEDLAAYADSEVARELFTRITPLLMGRPTARSYEVRRSASEQVVTKTFSTGTFPEEII